MKKVLFVILTVLLLSSCHTQRDVISAANHIDTLYVHKTDSVLKHDSIYVKDSIFTVIKGDTVTVNRWHTDWKYKYIYKVRKDTVNHNSIQRDTITYIKEAVPEKQLTKFEKSEIWSGRLLWLIIFCGLIYLIIRYRKKLVGVFYAFADLF